MHLIQRVTDIMLKPHLTWRALEQEPTTTSLIFRKYLVYLAVIPAVAGTPGHRLVDFDGFGWAHRFPFIMDCINVLLVYALALLMVRVVAYVVNSLAPTFGGVRNQINALKLVAYGATSAFVGCFFFLAPNLSLVGLPIILYSFYLVYLGLPVLMKCPTDEAVTYVSVVFCYVALIITAGVVATTLMGRASDEVASRLAPHLEKKLPAIGAKPSNDRARQQAAEANPAEAFDSARTEPVKPPVGASTVAFPPETLKLHLPSSMASLPLTSTQAQSGQGIGIQRSLATATYLDGDRRIDLSITDMGPGGAAVAAASWAKVKLDRKTPGMTERIYAQGFSRVREIFRQEGRVGEISVLLANGVTVEIKGKGLDLPVLQESLDAVKLSDIEAMQRPNK